MTTQMLLNSKCLDEIIIPFGHGIMSITMNIIGSFLEEHSKIGKKKKHNSHTTHRHY